MARINASINSLSVERIPVSDSYFSVVTYERLIGEPIGDSLWNETLFRRWGALIGKLHRLSPEYAPKRPRYSWYDSDFLNVQSYIPITDHEIRTGAEQVIQRAKDLPLSDFQYGLIHADVYQENLFWVEGDLLLFDFDNCEYGHYISDTEALPLFLRLREVLIYTVAKKMLDLNNLTPIQARLLAERGYRIRKNQPIVDLRPGLKSL